MNTQRTTGPSSFIVTTSLTCHDGMGGGRCHQLFDGLGGGRISLTCHDGMGGGRIQDDGMGGGR